MRTVSAIVACVVLSISGPAAGTRLTSSDNFIVMAPDQPLAEEIRDTAEQLRKEIALAWLGAELPAGKGRTIVTVNVVDEADRALTWLIDHPQRTMHSTWLTCPREAATGPLLAHEITHVVLATRFEGRVPAWADEGIASLQDDPRRIAIRNRMVAIWARDRTWPDLTRVLSAQAIAAHDRRAYAIAASLTQCLVARGGRARFLQFAIEGKEHGWDQALQRYYGIPTTRQLQTEWQIWTIRNSQAARAANKD